MTEHVLVIAGGIVGSSAAAYRLVCRGVWVILLDRADQGHAKGRGRYCLARDELQCAVRAERARLPGGRLLSRAGGQPADRGGTVILATGAWDDGWAAQLPFRPRGWHRTPRGAGLANGLGASGLTMGPYAGAADLACGDTLSLDIIPYDPARFGGG